MSFGKIVAPIALVVALLVPLLASANEVNRSLSADSNAVLAEIEAMNLTPLSDEVAGEIRGEEILPSWVVATGRAFTLTGGIFTYWQILTLAYQVSSSVTGYAYDVIAGSGVTCYRSSTANSTPVYCY